MPVAPFPRWLVCPHCRLLAPIQSGLFELRLDPYRKDRSRYVHRICKKPGKPPTVVPARFLVACEHGHLDDFPWVEFVHRGRPTAATNCGSTSWGPRARWPTFRCECVKCENKRAPDRRLQRGGQGGTGHAAEGAGPTCGSTTKTPATGGSGRSCWGPRIAGSRSCCRSCRSRRTTDKLGQLVEQNWAELEECESARDVKLKRKLLKGLAAYTEEQIWEAVVEQEGGRRSRTRTSLRPAGARVEGLLEPRPEPQQPGLQAAGRRAAPGLRQGLEEGRPGRAAAGGAGPDRVHPDRVAGRLHATLAISPRTSGCR